MKLVSFVIILFITGTFNSSDVNFEPPIDKDVPIVSNFGEKTHPVLLTTRFHNGIDYQVEPDSKIIASAAGTIKSVELIDEQWYQVIIDHGNGFETHYSQLSEVSDNLALATKVEQHDVLGVAGIPVHSVTPMLHFSILKDGEFVDPALYLKK
ncbi:MAG: M23 family metallopeptidase [Balneolaceae bacterium]|nr:M23 family metallopeptidase [Balneolaceae bacterium]